jgi:hypothetical protein
LCSSGNGFAAGTALEPQLWFSGSLWLSLLCWPHVQTDFPCGHLIGSGSSGLYMFSFTSKWREKTSSSHWGNKTPKIHSFGITMPDAVNRGMAPAGWLRSGSCPHSQNDTCGQRDGIDVPGGLKPVCALDVGAGSVHTDYSGGDVGQCGESTPYPPHLPSGLRTEGWPLLP